MITASVTLSFVNLPGTFVLFRFKSLAPTLLRMCIIPQIVWCWLTLSCSVFTLQNTAHIRCSSKSFWTALIWRNCCVIHTETTVYRSVICHSIVHVNADGPTDRFWLCRAYTACFTCRGHLPHPPPHSEHSIQQAHQSKLQHKQMDHFNDSSGSGGYNNQQALVNMALSNQGWAFVTALLTQASSHSCNPPKWPLGWCIRLQPQSIDGYVLHGNSSHNHGTCCCCSFPLSFILVYTISMYVSVPTYLYLTPISDTTDCTHPGASSSPILGYLEVLVMCRNASMWWVRNFNCSTGAGGTPRPKIQYTCHAAVTDSQDNEWTLHQEN